MAGIYISRPCRLGGFDAERAVALHGAEPGPALVPARRQGRDTTPLPS